MSDKITMKILIIEDDLLLQMGLKKALTQESYAFDVADCITQAKQYLDSDSQQNYCAILMDLGLPDGNGIHLLKQWREQGITLPVLIITARDALEDRIEGLDAGADDYLIKPFALIELQARLRAVIRRHMGQPDNHIHIDDLSLNLANKTIDHNGCRMDLTPREYAILSRLMLKHTQVVSREVLQQDLYSWQDSLGSNTLEVYVHRLRQKLGKDRIQTVRGLGYQLMETK